jgi:hypothetical protein
VLEPAITPDHANLPQQFGKSRSQMLIATGLCGMYGVAQPFTSRRHRPQAASGVQGARQHARKPGVALAKRQGPEIRAIEFR